MSECWIVTGGTGALGSAIVEATLEAGDRVVVPWIVFLVISLPRVPVRVLVDFSAYRESDALPVPEIAVAYEGLADRLLDFLGSFAHAFHPTADHGYAESFGLVALVVPVALGVAGWRLWHRRREGATALPTGFDTGWSTSGRWVAFSVFRRSPPFATTRADRQ